MLNVDKRELFEKPALESGDMHALNTALSEYAEMMEEILEKQAEVIRLYRSVTSNLNNSYLRR